MKLVKSKLTFDFNYSGDEHYHLSPIESLLSDEAAQYAKNTWGRYITVKDAPEGDSVPTATDLPLNE